MLDVKEDMKIDIQVYSPYNLIYVQYQEATVHPPPARKRLLTDWLCYCFTWNAVFAFAYFNACTLKKELQISKCCKTNWNCFNLTQTIPNYLGFRNQMFGISKIKPLKCSISDLSFYKINPSDTPLSAWRFIIIPKVLCDRPPANSKLGNVAKVTDPVGWKPQNNPEQSSYVDNQQHNWRCFLICQNHLDRVICLSV